MTLVPGTSEVGHKGFESDREPAGKVFISHLTHTNTDVERPVLSTGSSFRVVKLIRGCS